MGYHRIKLIVGIVICRAAVLQVLSQTSTPPSSSTTSGNYNRITTTSSTSQTSTIISTTEPQSCTEIFPGCLNCSVVSEINNVWECLECEGNDYEPNLDEDSCRSSKRNNISESCCTQKGPKGGFPTWAMITIIVGGSCIALIVIILVLARSICYCHKKRKRSRAEPPLPPPVNTTTVHTDNDGSQYRFDRKGNKVFIDNEMDNRKPIAPPLDVPHPPRDDPDDFGQVYDNDPERVRIEQGRRPIQPAIPGQFQLPKRAGLPYDEPPRSPPPVPGKHQTPRASPALRPPNPPPKPLTPGSSRPRSPPAAPPKPKPKPVVPRHMSNQPTHQPDFGDTYQIPDAEKGADFGETYDDVAPENNGFDWQESYDDVNSPSHQDGSASDEDDYDDVPNPSLQNDPHNLLANITQDSIIRAYGDDKLYQNQPVLDSKTKTSYRYRNLALTKGEKIESEVPYLVKR